MNNKTTRNYQSMNEYIDNLFNLHSRVLVLRIDLTYGKNIDTRFLSQQEIYQSYLQAKADREHLFRNTRSNSLFNDMVGYIWRLEYGKKGKGFHYHFFFFFDGSKVQQDITLARRIGEYWMNNIAYNRGIYHNCNAEKDKYAERCGIGMINWNDVNLIENLKQAALYLDKPDENLSRYAQHLDIGRTFGRGEIKAKTSNSGRPRIKTIDPQQERYASEIMLIEQMVHGIIHSEALFCVCDDAEVNNLFHIGAYEDFMLDVLNNILKYKDNITFVESTLSGLSVHPYVELFIRHMKDRLVGYPLYTYRRNRSQLNHCDVRVLNEFIESIRHEAGSPPFNKAINDYYNGSIVN